MMYPLQSPLMGPSEVIKCKTLGNFQTPSLTPGPPCHGTIYPGRPSHGPCPMPCMVEPRGFSQVTPKKADTENFVGPLYTPLLSHFLTSSISPLSQILAATLKKTIPLPGLSCPTMFWSPSF